MNQNYIKIFHNSGDAVTIEYGNKTDEQTLGIDAISIEREDLLIIANALIEMSAELEE